MEVILLGPVAVEGARGAVEIAGAQQRRLLAALALGRGRAVSEERLIDALWPDDPPASARRSLHAQVSRLRSAIADAGETEPITHPAPGYALETAPQDVDAERFERLAAEGRKALARGDGDDASARLAEALRVWSGPALAGARGSGWLEIEAQRLEDARLSATEERYQAILDLGLHADAVPELEALAAQNPLRERLWQLLIVALYRCGRQAEAAQAYDRARQHLAHELGIQPGPHLRALHAAVLTESPSLALPPSPITDGAQPALGKLQERKLEYMFTAIDADGDGLISGEDFARHGARLAALAPEGSPEEARIAGDVESWFAAVQAAGAGAEASIDDWLRFWAAWLAGVAADAEAGGGPLLEQLKSSIVLTFDAVDRDGDGVWDADDYARWIEAWGFPVDARANFTRLDADRDDRLPREDVVSLVKDFFLSNDPEAAGNHFYGPPFGVTQLTARAGS